MPKIAIPNAGLEFECAEDDTILRAALRSGLGMPYECNVGSCGNCRFELLDGAVEHVRADPPGLNERDKARNRWLGCQARPLADCRIKVPLREDYKSLHRPRRTTGRLVATQDVTHDIREFRFALETPTPFRPGQYGLLLAPGAPHAQAYSMANAGEPEEWTFQIRRVPGGQVTGALFDRLRIGDSVALDGPYGLAYLREEAPRDIVCMAGGSGLAPMISIARAFARSEKLASRSLDFIYGGRTPRDICGENILAELPGFGARIRYHCAISDPGHADSQGWSGRCGFVPDIAAELFGDALGAREIYFAGPPVMADAIMRMAIVHKVPAAQMHFDKFY